jgi:MerR family transcriptional regulator, light-induced transcriptional regulator
VLQALSLAYRTADQDDEPVPTDPTPTQSIPRLDPPAAPQLSVAATARRLGIAPATLRTWDRRYGLGPTEHSPGQHRRYSPGDIARLELMRYALVRGAAPAEAAAYATATAPGTPAPAGLVPSPTAPAAAGSGAEIDPEPAAGPNGGIRVAGVTLRLPDVGRRAHGLARAALALDPVAVRRALTDAVATLGIEPAWTDVVCPVLNAIADRWKHTGAGVEVEHLLSECVTGVFTASAVAAPTEPQARPVLLAGMPGEQHVLPLVALSAALAGRGLSCRLLGPNLPLAALAAAVRRTAPAVVVLWAHLPDCADVDALQSLPRTRPRFRAFAAGPGWADVVLPPRIGWLDALGPAREQISEAVPV